MSINTTRQFEDASDSLGKIHRWDLNSLSVLRFTSLEVLLFFMVWVFARHFAFADKGIFDFFGLASAVLGTMLAMLSLKQAKTLLTAKEMFGIDALIVLAVAERIFWLTINSCILIISLVIIQFF